ncbi:Glucose-insensitive transcription protein 7 [Smittium mucronatum]|uniref:Glucose-insensitive transcription protein 7 n=1 Tax=Smittium mucronatum TaxID=133383 RepID=A0A1R0GQB6_9FUNG|nr:Glucose-insensitive transcription protein 7 [Smittium mucronatum]
MENPQHDFEMELGFPKNIDQAVKILSKNNLIPKYEFYQNEDFIILDVFHKKKSDDELNIQFEKDSVQIKISNASGKTELNLEHLYKDIVPERSTYKTYTTKIELKLLKKSRGISWNQLLLTGSSSQSLSTPGIFNFVLFAKITCDIPNLYLISAAYPTSNIKKKNWDLIEKEIEKEDALNDGGSEVSSLFSKIYKDSDDDTRRAMMKSYIESNGTTLSTNWNEVKKGPVSVKPPQGMEPKQMAKSKNHTNHNQNSKAHRNGIKKPVRHRYSSLRGVDRKFMRNQRFSKRGSRNALLTKRREAAKATASA